MPQPNQLCSEYTEPVERAAWLALERSEFRLEKVLRNADGAEPNIGGRIYFWRDKQLVCAPAKKDGTPDKDHTLHRSEYAGMPAAELHKRSDQIEAWFLTIQDC
jgi:hypothetical protein